MHSLFPHSHDSDTCVLSIQGISNICVNIAVFYISILILLVVAHQACNDLSPIADLIQVAFDPLNG